MKKLLISVGLIFASMCAYAAPTSISDVQLDGLTVHVDVAEFAPLVADTDGFTIASDGRAELSQIQSERMYTLAAFESTRQPTANTFGSARLIEKVGWRFSI